MIYQIYRTYKSGKLSSKISLQNIKYRCNHHSLSFNKKLKKLYPYQLPQDHYQEQKLSQSLYQLNRKVQDVKKTNTKLASKILFSQGRQEAIKFMHRTKQFFGKKTNPLKNSSQIKKKNCHLNKLKTDRKQTEENIQNSQNELYDFLNMKPNFGVNFQKQNIPSRAQRRNIFGIVQADLRNFQSLKRGQPPSQKRKQILFRCKDFKKLNMKGFAARISASLQSKQNVSTSLLTRLMNISTNSNLLDQLKKKSFKKIGDLEKINILKKLNYFNI